MECRVFFTLFFFFPVNSQGKNPHKTKEEMRENETRYTKYARMQMEHVFFKYVSVKVILAFCTCNNHRLEIYREIYIERGLLIGIFKFFFRCVLIFFSPLSSML